MDQGGPAQVIPHGTGRGGGLDRRFHTALWIPIRRIRKANTVDTISVCPLCERGVEVLLRRGIVRRCCLVIVDSAKMVDIINLC